MRILILKMAIVAVFFAGFLLAQGSFALASDSTTSEFVKLCSEKAHQKGCSELLAEWLMNSEAACVPVLEDVIETLKQHPEWNDKGWTEGVDAALEILCKK